MGELIRNIETCCSLYEKEYYNNADLKFLKPIYDRLKQEYRDLLKKYNELYFFSDSSRYDISFVRIGGKLITVLEIASSYMLRDKTLQELQEIHKELQEKGKKIDQQLME